MIPRVHDFPGIGCRAGEAFSSAVLTVHHRVRQTAVARVDRTGNAGIDRRELTRRDRRHQPGTARVTYVRPMTDHQITLGAINLAAADPAALAEFWAAVTGAVPAPNGD